MTPLLGISDGPWTRLVRRPHTAVILTYLRDQWSAYASEFGTSGPPFSSRSEPQLTEALAAFLARQQAAGLQPFDGEFFGELTRFDLAQDGTRVVTGRTDIEWRLFGFASFVVEFKVIDATRKAIKYVTDGMVRFVDGRYAPRFTHGAMWAFVAPTSPENATNVIAHLTANASILRCVEVDGSPIVSPSKLAPDIAAFDSLHERSPNCDAILLAHLFVTLPANG